MTVSTPQPEAERVAGILEAHAGKIAQRRANGWDFTLANGRLLRATAEVTDRWLVLWASAWTQRPDARPVAVGRLWPLACETGRLPGGVKYAIDPRNRLFLRAEMPPGDTPDWQERLEAILTGFKVAADRLLDPSGERPADAEPFAGEASDGTGRPNLRRLCEEAGWPCIERAGGRLAVELETTGFHEAIVARQGRGTHLAVTAGMDGISETSRQAIAALLLRANGVVRMARAATTETADRAGTRFEVALGGEPTAAGLQHGLSALSVMCRLCAREVEFLRDPRAAEVYLRLQGWSRAACSDQTRETKGDPP